MKKVTKLCSVFSAIFVACASVPVGYHLAIYSAENALMESAANFPPQFFSKAASQQAELPEPPIFWAGPAPENPTAEPEPTPEPPAEPPPARPKPEPQLLKVPHIGQSVHYPTGCEPVSAVMALQYLGVEITVSQFINQYLDCGVLREENGLVFGPHSSECFVGNPRDVSNSFGCYARSFKKPLKKWAALYKQSTQPDPALKHWQTKPRLGTQCYSGRPLT